MTRALGNYHLKKFIINTPSIKKVLLEDVSNTYFVIASDGLWNYTMDKGPEKERVCNEAMSLQKDAKSSGAEWSALKLADRLLCFAYYCGSRDNICIVAGRIL